MFCMWSMPRLHNENQWDKPVSGESTVKDQFWYGTQPGTMQAEDPVGSCYQATNSEDVADWEGLACVIVIC
jgi:hypothetical protein